MDKEFFEQIAKNLDGFRVVIDAHGRSFLFKGNEYKWYVNNNQDHAQGMQIWVRKSAYYKGRISCIGYSPYNQDPSITVKGDSSPERIAQQIKQRLLPAYQKIWEENVKIFQERQSNENKAAAIVANLIEQVGGSVSPNNVLQVYGDGCTYEVIPANEPIVNITHLTGLPANKALKILKIIKEVWESKV